MKRKSKSRVLAVLGWHDPRMIYGIGRYALEADWHLESRGLLSETFPRGWQGEGMLVGCPHQANVRHFVRRQAKRQPTVLLGLNNPGIRTPCVSIDNYAVGRLAAQHLLERGHKHLVWYNLFGGPVAATRRDGFLKTVAAAGRQCTLLENVAAEGSSLSWTRRRAWLLARLRRISKPCGLLAIDDQLASEAIEACLYAGLNVPGDVSVVGVGNLEFACAASSVSISSVDTREEEVAYQAAALLGRAMNKEAVPSSPVLIPPQRVVTRLSSDFMAVVHPQVVAATKYMEDNLTSPINMEDIAEAANVSRRTLYYLFAAELRMSPADHLLRMRIEKAKRLLLTTDLKIGRIADFCGLGSSRSINRSFWRLENMSPRNWRLANRPGR